MQTSIESKMEALLHRIVQDEQQKLQQLGFIETYIPSPESRARCNIFLSANWHICDRLLIVIASGNGIQPGIWSRSLVLESSETANQYRSGSMLPYVHTALYKGYGVIITNPSTNMMTVDNEKLPIPGSSTPEMHVRFIWMTFGVRAACSQVYIAAYSRGGELAKHLMETQASLRTRLAAIAFIESSHRTSSHDSNEVRELLGTRAINWQRSKEAAGSQLPDNANLGCLSLSAGQPQGVADQKRSNTAWTIAASMETVFDFFNSACTPIPNELQQVENLSLLSKSMYQSVISEHQEDAEMVLHEEELDMTNGSMERRSTRSMVVSTSMSVTDFDLLSVVGKGAYGKVFLVQKKSGRNANRVYAMKVLRKQDVFKKDQVEHTKSEQRILKTIEHPFIIRLRYAFQNDYKLYLVMDYYSGGSLYIHLRKCKRFTEARARFYAAELLLALAHLHQMKVMYRDLKLENILMDSEGHVVITDFGLSKEDDEGSTFVGTPEYLAPELLSSQRSATSYGKTVDWWSFGVLIYEMIQGQTPFYAKNRRELFQNILTKSPQFSPELFSNTAVHLLTRILVKKPEDRLGCGVDGPIEIQSHPWFHGIDWDALKARRVEPPYRPTSSGFAGSTKDLLQFVPDTFKQQEVVDSPVCGVLTSSRASNPMHFEDFSYMGSDVMGSRRTSIFRESDLRMSN